MNDDDMIFNRMMEIRDQVMKMPYIPESLSECRDCISTLNKALQDLEKFSKEGLFSINEIVFVTTYIDQRMSQILEHQKGLECIENAQDSLRSMINIIKESDNLNSDDIQMMSSEFNAVYDSVKEMFPDMPEKLVNQFEHIKQNTCKV